MNSVKIIAALILLDCIIVSHPRLGFAENWSYEGTYEEKTLTKSLRISPTSSPSPASTISPTPTIK